MTPFRAFLIALWTVLLVYTSLVIQNHGMWLLPVFFGDILKMRWPGQFNLDFLMMLTLSALWVAWRNRFSAAGRVLAALTLFGGAGFLLPYLLVLSFQSGGNMSRLLLGRQGEGSAAV